MERKELEAWMSICKTLNAVVADRKSLADDTMEDELKVYDDLITYMCKRIDEHSWKYNRGLLLEQLEYANSRLRNDRLSDKTKTKLYILRDEANIHLKELDKNV